MNEDILFRSMKGADVEALADLIGIIFAAEEDFSIDREKQIQALRMFLLNEENSRVFVAEYQGQPVGVCSAQLLISTAEGGYKAIVEDVVVSPSMQGKKVGQKLLQQVQLWAKEKNVRRLDLAPDIDNEKGLVFYDKLGWHKTNMILLQKKI